MKLEKRMMEIEEEIKEILNKEVTFSFGKINENSNKVIRVELEIKIKEDILETFLLMGEHSTPYINLQADENLTNFFSTIYSKVSLKNKNAREHFFMNETCRRGLIVVAIQKFKKTNYFKLRCLYDPNFKKKV
jgi:hypothetical protein